MYMYMYMYIHVYIYIHIHACVSVCMCTSYISNCAIAGTIFSLSEHTLIQFVLQ